MSLKTTDVHPESTISRIRRVCGVDYSGAIASGKTAWWCQASVVRRRPGTRLRVDAIGSLGESVGSDHRDAVNKFLVQGIVSSDETLWGLDFPFGLPIELGLGSWSEQLRHLASHAGDAKSLGRSLVARSEAAGFGKHVRRTTDTQTKTPFDCYHYRIVYQMFHGMRDVLLPISRRNHVAVLPFQYRRLATARVIVAETCPSSTLKRLSLPHRLYKQTAGKPPTPEQIGVRRLILESLTDAVCGCVDLADEWVDTMLSDPGGDALDSLIAAVGVFQSFRLVDHAAIARDSRHPVEGCVYA